MAKTDKIPRPPKPADLPPAKTKLEQWMRDEGWTATTLAPELGVAREQVHAYAKALYRPRLEVILELNRISRGKVPPESWLSVK